MAEEEEGEGLEEEEVGMPLLLERAFVDCEEEAPAAKAADG